MYEQTRQAIVNSWGKYLGSGLVGKFAQGATWNVQAEPVTNWEIYSELYDEYGDDAPSEATVKWFRRMAKGWDNDTARFRGLVETNGWHTYDDVKKALGLTTTHSHRQSHSNFSSTIHPAMDQRSRAQPARSRS